MEVDADYEDDRGRVMLWNNDELSIIESNQWLESYLSYANICMYKALYLVRTKFRFF